MKFADMPPEKKRLVKAILASMKEDCEEINSSLNRMSEALETEVPDFA